MNVEPQFKGESIWGYKVGIFKNGVKLTDILVQVRARATTTTTISMFDISNSILLSFLLATVLLFIRT